MKPSVTSELGSEEDRRVGRVGRDFTDFKSAALVAYKICIVCLLYFFN